MRVQRKTDVSPEIPRISYFYRDFLYFPILCYIFLGFPINGHPHLVITSCQSSFVVPSQDWKFKNKIVCVKVTSINVERNKSISYDPSPKHILAQS